MKNISQRIGLQHHYLKAEVWKAQDNFCSKMIRILWASAIISLWVITQAAVCLLITSPTKHPASGCAGHLRAQPQVCTARYIFILSLSGKRLDFIGVYCIVMILMWSTVFPALLIMMYWDIITDGSLKAEKQMLKAKKIKRMSNL